MDVWFSPDACVGMFVLCGMFVFVWLSCRVVFCGVVWRLGCDGL